MNTKLILRIVVTVLILLNIVLRELHIISETVSLVALVILVAGFFALFEFAQSKDTPA